MNVEVETLSQIGQFADLALRAFVIPLGAVLWRLQTAITDLKLSLHRDFVSRETLDDRLELERRIPRENETRIARLENGRRAQS